MSPPNLDRLLVLPHGCGEQNLVRMATNWVVADYLVVTEQLSDFIAVKIKENIQTGTILVNGYKASNLNPWGTYGLGRS